MAELRAALAAVAFLTRLPVPAELGADDVRRAGPWFPLVGAGIGGATGAASYGVAQVLPPLAAAGVALALMALLTGALHLDALADTADALGGSTRERALEIMRDHRVGSYGATALLLDLLLRAAALAALAGTAHVVAVAAAAGALSRGASVALAGSLPYARAGEGTGAALTRASRGRDVAACVVAVAAALAVARVDGAVLVLVGAGVTLGARPLVRRRLGGVTGDVLGAVSELVEVGGLLAAAAL
jgi:adenosylcobinamide-GDP ribazoletransferase